MTSVLNMTMTQKYTSLSRATINRHREIGDFPQALQLTGNRIGFYVSELDEWLAGRPRKKGPEVNDNKKLLRCPQTPSELAEARQQDYAELKAKRQGDAV